MKPILAKIAILTLAACTGEPTPKIETGEVFAKSRVVLVKGRQGGSSPMEPYLERRSYQVTCAPGNEGGTPAQRADAMMAALPAGVGQVEHPAGANIMRESDYRRINTFAVPRYRCSVGYPPVYTVEGTGEATIMAWALQNNAIEELAKER